MPCIASTGQYTFNNPTTRMINTILNCNKATVNLENAKKCYNAIASDPKITELCVEFIAAKNRVAKCEYNLRQADIIFDELTR